MKKSYFLFTAIAILLIIIAAPSLQKSFKTSSDSKLLFGDVNNLLDAQSMIFNWYEEPAAWAGGFSLYYDEEEMMDLLANLKNIYITNADLNDYDIGVGIPNSYLVAVVHDMSENIYTTFTVLEDGTIHIWNRYSHGDVPAFYSSEGNADFYKKISDIVLRNKNRQQENISSGGSFEYKSEDPNNPSIFEIRSEDGQLIADINDIDRTSVEVVDRELGGVGLAIRFIDKDFVLQFTRAHLGQSTHFYIDGILITSPMINQALFTNEIIIDGDFSEIDLDAVMEKIKN